jgi:glyoxylase-like metal-dependent hydrolase (beta-lactamase superfamily II)
MANLSWRIGAITITRLFDGEGAAYAAGGEHDVLPLAFPETIRKIPWMAPDWADDEGRLYFSLHALLIETDGYRLVVDTCVGNHKRRHVSVMNMRDTTFLSDLEAAGWPRDSVDGVLCTHLHVDHVGWNTMWVGDRWEPTFPKARYFMARSELGHWKAEFEHARAKRKSSNEMLADDEAQSFADSVWPILEAGLEELVETDARIAPGVRLMPTPGHTPGHVSVIIESEGERAVITGDLMHNPCQIAFPNWSSSADTDPEESRRSRRHFLAEFADTPTLVIGTHFGGPTAGCVRRDGDNYWLDGRGEAMRFRA